MYIYIYIYMIFQGTQGGGGRYTPRDCTSWTFGEAPPGGHRQPQQATGQGEGKGRQSMIASSARVAQYLNAGIVNQTSIDNIGKVKVNEPVRNLSIPLTAVQMRDAYKNSKPRPDNRSIPDAEIRHFADSSDNSKPVQFKTNKRSGKR